MLNPACPSLVPLRPFDPRRFHADHLERVARMGGARKLLMPRRTARKPKPTVPPAQRYDPWSDDEVAEVLLDGTVVYREIHLVPRRPVADRITVRDIVRAAAAQCGVTIADVCSCRRNAAVMRPRLIAYWLSRYCTPRTLPEIGRAIGGRDHTSVLSGIRKVDRLLAAGDAELASDIAAIKARLGIEEHRE